MRLKIIIIGCVSISLAHSQIAGSLSEVQRPINIVCIVFDQRFATSLPTPANWMTTLLHASLEFQYTAYCKRRTYDTLSCTSFTTITSIRLQRQFNIHPMHNILAFKYLVLIYFATLMQILVNLVYVSNPFIYFISSVPESFQKQQCLYDTSKAFKEFLCRSYCLKPYFFAQLGTLYDFFRELLIETWKHASTLAGGDMWGLVVPRCAQRLIDDFAQLLRYVISRSFAGAASAPQPPY